MSSKTLEADHKTDVLTILYPMKNPCFEATLSALRENLRMRQSICEDAFVLHEVCFDCSLDNWRWYKREMGERLMKKNGLALVSNRKKQSRSRVSSEYKSCVSRLILALRLCLSRGDPFLFSLLLLTPSPSTELAPH
jgi:hypothetical protein